VALDSVRAKLRQLHSRLNEFRTNFQSFSPGDPEPFGSLVEAALDHSVGVELVLRGLFERYAALHEALSKLRAVRDWKIVQLPWLWYNKQLEIKILAGDIVQFEPTLDELLQYHERLIQLNYDVAKRCQAVLQESNHVSSDFEKLYKMGLRGQLLDQAREEIRNWQSTIINQVPVLFFSTDSEIIRSQTDKDATARVHRLNQTAGPEIARLQGVADEWNQNLNKFAGFRQKLTSGLPNLVHVLDELSQAQLFPIIWENTKSRIESLSNEVQRLDGLAANHDVGDLLDLAGESTSLYEEFIQLSEKMVDARSDHMELCSQHLSEDMANGPETLKSAYQLVESIAKYNPENFSRGDAVENLIVDINSIASLQGRYQRYSSSSELNENELGKRLEQARNLTMQYKSIAPRIQNIRKRLSEVSEMEQSALKKLEELQYTATSLGTLMEGNPPLRKSVGSEHLKIKNQAAALSEEFTRREADTIEKKVERCQALYLKATKDLEKWSDALVKEIKISHDELSSRIGLLRDLVWLDDPVMAEVEYLLSSVSKEGSHGDNYPGAGERLVNKVDNLARACDLFQRYSSALRQIDQIAGPIISNYRLVEQVRDSTSIALGKLNDIFPKGEEPWPPTNVRIGNEQAKSSQLEKEWSALRKDRIKPAVLAGKLSTLLGVFKAHEARLNECLNLTKQEQGKFREYERRMEESQKMWKRVEADYMDNRNVRDGVDQLIDSIDQDLERLRSRYLRGELNYALALQGMKQICRKLDEGVVEIDQSQLVDINGEIQRRL
jgi:hypothetical protein